MNSLQNKQIELKLQKNIIIKNIKINIMKNISIKFNRINDKFNLKKSSIPNNNL